VAADGSTASLLVQVGDKKSKKKKHNDGGDQTSGLTECTIVQPGGAVVAKAASSGCARK
jgi:hypothetical protein